MSVSIQNDATGAGSGNLDASQAFVDLGIIANGDTGLGLGATSGDRQRVTYARADPGIPPNRLDTLVNTNFTPDYGRGAGAQTVPIVIIPVLANFTLNDGTSILVVGGTSLPPQNSGLAGAALNATNDCLVIYDTTQNNGSGYCTARQGTGGTLDLQTPNPVILYHELSHAFRIVTNAQLALSAVCNPSSPEERAAITDENDERTQLASAAGVSAVLRDPGIHCGAVCTGGSTGTCCIVASVASGSPLSDEVATLRGVRDGVLRRSDVGFAFFERLHRDYYGFSPQVSTLLAGDPLLRRLVLEGLVRPLVIVLRLMEAYLLAGNGPDEIGARFLADHDEKDLAKDRMKLLERGDEVLRDRRSELSAGEQELAALVAPGLRSAHVVWGIVEPIKIYGATLKAYLGGSQAEELGERFATMVDAWSAQIPLDDIWLRFSTAELDQELEILDATLLRSPVAKGVLRDRVRALRLAASIKQQPF